MYNFIIAEHQKSNNILGTDVRRIENRECNVPRYRIKF